MKSISYYVVFVVFVSLFTCQCSDEAGGEVTLGQPYFKGRISLTGGSGVVSADYNEDGIPDLAITRGPEDTMQVFLGKGDGTFESPLLNPSGGGNPEAICTADFNKDGHLDIAVSHRERTWVSVFLGKGDGTCGAPVNYTSFYSVNWLSNGDFNGDGNADILVSNAGQSSIVLLYGDGQGDFPTRSVISGISTFYTARGDVADFDGDGYTDIVIQQRFSLIVIFCNPDGSLDDRVRINIDDAQIYLSTTKTGDLNGDGLPDILTGPGPRNFAYAIFSEGNRTFRTPSEISVANVDHYGYVIADINGDTIVDIVTTGSGGNENMWHGIRTLLGTGGGEFTEGPSSYSYTILLKPLVIDVNRDGIADLIGMDHSNYNTCIMFGNGDGSFFYEKIIGRTYGSEYYDIAVNDMDHDGTVDIIAMNASLDAKILLFRGPDFAEPVTLAVIPEFLNNGQFNAMRTGDLNHDGHLDLVATHDRGFAVYLNKGDLTFDRHDYKQKQEFSRFDLNDYDGDGSVDMAVMTVYSGRVFMYRGSPDGSFTLVDETELYISRQIVSGFVDGDTTREIAISAMDEEGQCIHIYKTSVDGDLGFHLQYTLRYDIVTAVISYIALKDVTGDGKTDLIFLSKSRIYTVPGMGDGTFSGELRETILGGGGGYYSFVLFDFSGDGIDDIVVINLSNWCTATMIGRGDGTFYERVGYYGENPYYSIHYDINGDGLQDILAFGLYEIAILYAAPPTERTMPALTGIWPYIAVMTMTVAIGFATRMHVQKSIHGIPGPKQGPPPSQSEQSSSLTDE